MTAQVLWEKANLNLIAKAIGELAYEQVLFPLLENSASFYCENGYGENGCLYRTYHLPLKSGVTYSFQAWRSVWDHLRVRADSIHCKRTTQNIPIAERCSPLLAGQFFIDSKHELGTTDIVLGTFLEEMQSTLFSDMKLLEKTSILSAQELANWSGNQLQAILNGHPKILLNKGRMGWGVNDLENFSPETSQGFQLHWIALLKENAVTGFQANACAEVLLQESLRDEEIATLHALLTELGRNKEDYLIIPTHPWQWDQILQIQFAGEIASGTIISLGKFGDKYQPQISIRTLSNSSRPEKSDIKLPLTILNTSAVRGIPSRYISSAPAVADAISRICNADTLLVASKTSILAEKGGISFQHPQFSQVSGAPYRYQETLGCIWRESVDFHLEEDEMGILTGSLFHQDAQGQSLIGAYISRSGVGVEEWLKKYFEVVVVPLYHLQIVYGLGLVAHGQNIVLRLKRYIPHGIFLKDIQGDLRSSNEVITNKKHSSAIQTANLQLLQLLDATTKSLDKLPPEYLIHDLLTGHFLTVLRFVSECLQESNGFPEKKFYQIMSDVIRNYLERNFDSQMDPRVDLLAERIRRVLLNKVRFKIGYEDSAVRPLPLLGEDLINPLARGAL